MPRCGLISRASGPRTPPKVPPISSSSRRFARELKPPSSAIWPDADGSPSFPSPSISRTPWASRSDDNVGAPAAVVDRQPGPRRAALDEVGDDRLPTLGKTRIRRADSIWRSVSGSFRSTSTSEVRGPPRRRWPSAWTPPAPLGLVTIAQCLHCSASWTSSRWRRALAFQARLRRRNVADLPRSPPPSRGGGLPTASSPIPEAGRHRRPAGPLDRILDRARRQRKAAVRSSGSMSRSSGHTARRSRNCWTIFLSRHVRSV